MGLHAAAGWCFMSRYDYEASKQAAMADYPFYALIMTAMRQADTNNSEKLKAAWPEVWEELHARYHAPGGQLPNDPERALS